MDLSHPSHMLVSGKTRSGKSSFVYGLLNQMRCLPVTVAGVDPTGILFNELGDGWGGDALRPRTHHGPEPFMVRGRDYHNERRVGARDMWVLVCSSRAPTWTNENHSPSIHLRHYAGETVGVNSCDGEPAPESLRIYTTIPGPAIIPRLRQENRGRRDEHYHDVATPAHTPTSLVTSVIAAIGVHVDLTLPHHPV